MEIILAFSLLESSAQFRLYLQLQLKLTVQIYVKSLRSFGEIKFNFICRKISEGQEQKRSENHC